MLLQLVSEHPLIKWAVPISLIFCFCIACYFFGRLKLPKSLPSLYVERELPKRQEKGFFASMFAGNQEQLDRDELCEYLNCKDALFPCFTLLPGVQ